MRQGSKLDFKVDAASVRSSEMNHSDFDTNICRHSRGFLIKTDANFIRKTK